MMDCTLKEFAESQFAERYGLRLDGNVLRPSTLIMKDLLQVEFEIGKDAKAVALNVRSPQAILNHPVVKPLISAFLVDLVAHLGAESQDKEWFETLPTSEIILDSIVVKRSTIGEDVTFTIGPKKRGFWSLFSG